MADGEVIDLPAESHYFDTKVVPKIQSGEGYLTDHDQFGKQYFFRNVTSMLALDEPVYQEQMKKKLLPKMRQIGFRK
jgi:hypothetical protein